MVTSPHSTGGQCPAEASISGNDRTIVHTDDETSEVEAMVGGGAWVGWGGEEEGR